VPKGARNALSIEDLVSDGRLLARQPSFLKKPWTLEEAQAQLRSRLQNRADVELAPDELLPTRFGSRP